MLEDGGVPTTFEVVGAVHIGEPPIDFGDAPDPLIATAGEYPTLVVNDGARHMIPTSMPMPGLIPPFVPGPRLGPTVGPEPDGQPTAAADGDDKNVLYDDGTPYPPGDETGVSFGSPLVVSQSSSRTAMLSRR